MDTYIRKPYAPIQQSHVVVHYIINDGLCFFEQTYVMDTVKKFKWKLKTLKSF